MDTVRVRAHESSDFRLKSIENHSKTLILQSFYGSGRRSRKFESCHLDINKRTLNECPFIYAESVIFDLGCCIATTASSHSPLEDRQARLSDEERANLRASREYLVTNIHTSTLTERGRRSRFTHPLVRILFRLSANVPPRQKKNRANRFVLFVELVIFQSWLCQRHNYELAFDAHFISSSVRRMISGAIFLRFAFTMAL